MNTQKTLAIGLAGLLVSISVINAKAAQVTMAAKREATICKYDNDVPATCFKVPPGTTYIVDPDRANTSGSQTCYPLWGTQLWVDAGDWEASGEAVNQASPKATETRMWAKRKTWVCDAWPPNSQPIGCFEVPAMTSYAFEPERSVTSPPHGLLYPMLGGSKWVRANDWAETEEEAGDGNGESSELGSVDATPVAANIDQYPAAKAVLQNVAAAVSVYRGQFVSEDEAELSKIFVMMEQAPEDISDYPAMIGPAFAQAVLQSLASSNFCDKVNYDAFNNPVMYKMKLGFDLYSAVKGSQMQPGVQPPPNSEPILYQELIAAYREQRAALACLGE